MARIPTYEAGGDLPIPNAPSLPFRREVVPDIGAGVARGQEIAARNLEGVGAAVGNVGADVSAVAAQQQAEADDAWLSKARAQTALDWHEQEANLATSAATVAPGMAGGGPTGTGAVAPGKPVPLQDQTKQALNAYLPTVVKDAPSARAQKAFTNWFQGFSADAQAKAFDIQQNRMQVQKASDLNDALNNHVQLVSVDPTQFDQAWQHTEEDLAAATWMTPQQLVQTRADIRAKMELARASTMAKNQPLQFQREVQPQQYDVASGTGTPSKGFVDNPYYSHLGFDQVAALLQDANSAVVHQHIAAVAEQTQQHTQQYNDLMTSLLPGGSGGLSDVWEARRQGWLTKYDEIKQAVDAVNSRDKDAMQLAQAQALFTTGHTFNPLEDADKKAVDLVYKSVGGSDGLVAPPQPGLSAPVPGSSGDPRAAAAVRLHAFVGQTNIIPQSAVDELSAGTVSRDPNQMMTAFTILDGLDNANPDALQRALGDNSPIMKRLDQYRSLAATMTPEDLVKAMNPNQDPAVLKARDQLRTAGKELLNKEVAAGNDYLPAILDSFGPGWRDWIFGPSKSASAQAPIDPIATQIMRNDYVTNFSELYALSGDEVSAKANAIKALGRSWKVTQIGSGVHIMKQPPEAFFPAIGGNHDWMDQQAEDMVHHSLPGASVTSWAPVALPETTGAAGIHATPKWGLGALTSDGAFHVLTPPPNALPGWPFNYDAAHAKALSDFNAARGSLLNAPPRPEPFNPLKAIVDTIASGRRTQPGEAPGRPYAPGVNPMKAYPPTKPEEPPEPVEGSFGRGLHTMKHPSPMESQEPGRLPGNQ